MNYSMLTVFTDRGATFTFRNVTVNQDNETTLTFVYTAMSDGKLKVARFDHRRIVGWSTTEYERP